MLYIGIDLGTSAVKLLLLNEHGKIEKTVSKEYPLLFPKPMWSEQNPEDWYEQTIIGLRELTCQCDKSKIAGISFAGQMHGLVVVDSEDNVIRPAILWNDARAKEETDYLNEVIGKEKLYEYTGNVAFAGFTAPKILWLKNHEPENFKRVSKIFLPKDYISYRLSGNFSTDMSDASGTLLLDVKKRCWSKEMLSICGISETMLPNLYESYEVTGTIRNEIAVQLGLPDNVKLIAGAGDNEAAAVGTGTVGEGKCNISLGTSGTIFVSSRKFNIDKNNALHSFAHADGGYHMMGCMLSAAMCNKWWNEKILKTFDYETEQKSICTLGENSVYFAPYLMGERSPHNDPNVRAAFFGLSPDTERVHMTQAVLEGVAFGLRDCLEAINSLGITVKRAKICGGGAKSRIWKKIIANVLNIELDVLKTEEGPAMGAAVLACVGCGEFADVHSAVDAFLEITETVKPENELVKKYEIQYRKFKKLYPAIKKLL